MTTHDILFELGCEELPPKSLNTLRLNLAQLLGDALQQAGLPFAMLHSYAAPRRLAIYIEKIAAQQTDRIEQKLGPAISAAYTADGKPTPAALGFASNAGVAFSDLSPMDTPKGQRLGIELKIRGQTLAALLPKLISEALNDLPIAKRMRSAASRSEFVRPVKWVVLMQDDQVIDAVIAEKQTGKISYGHRFHAPSAITLTHASHYVEQLKHQFVLVDFETRKQSIIVQTQQLADVLNAKPIMPETLIEEVTSLVEWPVALRASFETRFLLVPQEALISTMQDNQKYFCLLDDAGKLLPHFITISNIESKDPEQIIHGNEKVVRPRLTDAEFFFKQDQKTPLSAREVQLKSRIFQAKLGSVWDKVCRVEALAVAIGEQLHGDITFIRQAAQLCKCDLATDMVGEFPELQGIAGSYYAQIEGYPAEVSQAIREHYLPRFSSDTLPNGLTGICLALADRIDTICAIFAINQPPSGSKDPFSLRRAAIGILRLIIEKSLPLDLTTLITRAANAFTFIVPDTTTLSSEVITFINSRYRAMYEDQGIAVDVIQAVQAIEPTQPLDFNKRIRAVNTFLALPESRALAAANKRVNNILAKAPHDKLTINTALFEQPAESNLYQAFSQIERALTQDIATADYSTALQRLAALKIPLDRFFEDVMVMTDNPAVQQNRLALLQLLHYHFGQIADISLLQS